MLRYVFKRGRVYRGRYRLSNGPRIYDVALRTDKKHIAEEKLRRHVLELEEELAGFIKPKAQREAAERPLAKHLEQYLADLRAQGRSKKHVAVSRARISRLCQDCGWRLLRDITADGFNAWRARQTLAPKTLNEYLGLCSTFVTWMERNGRCQGNPLRAVVSAETRGKQRRKRRALTIEEIDRLIAAGGRWRDLYAIAASTGLRRGELKALDWADVDLDAPVPVIRVRASTTKNKEQATLPLLPVAVEAFRCLRAARANPVGKVFRRGIAEVATLRRDLERVGIPYEDTLGRHVDLHALARTSLCTALHVRGVPMRIAQEIMRHRDVRLTAEVYTDTAALPIYQELLKLRPPARSQIGSQKGGFLGVKAPFVDQVGGVSEDTQTFDEDHVVQACPNLALVPGVGVEPTRL